MDRAGDTIVAIATPPGRGGIGIVRLSGPQARPIAQSLTGAKLKPRHAHYHRVCDAAGEVMDDAVVIYFKGPHSYTGEDVVELQMHGSPVLLSQMLACCVTLGARRARPGEFSERAYLNERLDLAQAEAVADLINAGSEAAARAARRSLDGEFSRRVQALLELLIQLRVYIEAALDFPEEEIDFLAAPELRERWQQTETALRALRRDAERGVRLLDGLHAVIIGAPNVGKSSLLNALAGEERAIVTDIAGTTRDVLREAINLDGVALLLVDTAGLRATGDAIEAEGMRRARAELTRADLVLAMLDDTQPGAQESLRAELKGAPRVVWVHNKADLSGRAAGHTCDETGEHLWLSARTGAGLDGLRRLLARLAGQDEAGLGTFSARTRHLEALAATAAAVAAAGLRLAEGNGELAAEDLAQAQRALAEITGAMDAEALLGRIFSSFCIGK